MPSARISEPAHEVLRRLADESGEPMQAILDKAVEMYRRQRFLDESNRAFEALRADPTTRKSEQAERVAWDITLADGLDRE
ncbi:MAG TPA: toxin-antitoxin system protein [Patescibacteria group bacterium]|nr:toxin-antitoxin system protein [Patescibacteria group bacterium]